MGSRKIVWRSREGAVVSVGTQSGGTQAKNVSMGHIYMVATSMRLPHLWLHLAGTLTLAILWATSTGRNRHTALAVQGAVPDTPGRNRHSALAVQGAVPDTPGAAGADHGDVGACRAGVRCAHAR
eukprot:970523-Pelagomonas_calceolata.AAC.10